MKTSENKRRFRALLLFGIVYFVVGFTSSSLSSLSSSDETGIMWRWAAWLASAAAFAVHIWYEHSCVRNPPRWAALHASAAVAFGAFALAFAANIHDLFSPSGYRPLMLIALVGWPILTAVPAFVVAFVAAAGLARIRPRI